MRKKYGYLFKVLCGNYSGNNNNNNNNKIYYYYYLGHYCLELTNKNDLNTGKKVIYNNKNNKN